MYAAIGTVVGGALLAFAIALGIVSIANTSATTDVQDAVVTNQLYGNR